MGEGVGRRLSEVELRELVRIWLGMRGLNCPMVIDRLVGEEGQASVEFSMWVRLTFDLQGRVIETRSGGEA